jgi:site-specific recombinase XerD
MTAHRDNKLLSQSFFENYFIDFLVASGASKKTQKNYLYDIQGFFDWMTHNEPSQTITHQSLQAITADDIRSYVTSLQDKHSANTITRHLSSIKTFFQGLEQTGLVESNPVAQYQHPIDNQVPYVLPEKSSLHKWKIQQITKGENPTQVSRDIQHVQDFIKWIHRNNNL